MRTPFLLTCFLAILFNLSGFADVRQEKLAVHFEHDRFELTDAEIERLSVLVDRIKQNYDYEVILTGHTDDNGTNDYNKKLSAKRTQFIRNWMIEQGVDKDAVSIAWHGELQPEVPNNNESNRGMNRRVEIELISYEFNSTDEIMEALVPENIQKFEIDPKRENLIEGRNGIRVSIKPNSLLDKNGNPVSGQVEIELTEAMNFKEFMANNLSTLSGNELLVSGGMMKVEAKTLSGEELQLNPDQPMEVLIPAESREEGMELFVSDDGGNWQPAGQRPRTQMATWNLETESEIWASRPHSPKKVDFLPKAKLKRTKSPSKPFYPLRPSKPHKPRKSNYIAYSTWFQRTFQPNKANEFKEGSYIIALGQYEEKMKKYDQKMEVYKEQLKTYPELIKTYNKQYKKWKNQDRETIQAFRNSPEYQKRIDAYDKFYEEEFQKYEEEMEIWQIKYDAWLIERKEATVAAGAEFDRLGVTTEHALNSYVYEMNELGWINCDRFTKTPPELKKRLAITDTDTTDEKVFLVFEEIKSMLQMGHFQDQYFMDQYPVNEKAKIFAFKVEDGMPLLCYQNATAKSVEKLDFKPTKFKEIKRILEELNGQVSS